MRRYYTVVYRVDGGKAQQDAWWAPIQPLFLNDSEPVCITAISAADEVTRLQCMEHIVAGAQHRGEKLRAIEEMLVHPDPLAWWRENVKPEPEPAAEAEIGFGP
jgi:hypothetical protein